MLDKQKLRNLSGDFHGGPLVRTSACQCKGCQFDHWSGSYCQDSATFRPSPLRDRSSSLISFLRQLPHVHGLMHPWSAFTLSSSKLLGGPAVTSIPPRAGPVPRLGMDPVLEYAQRSLLHHSLSGLAGVLGSPLFLLPWAEQRPLA